MLDLSKKKQFLSSIHFNNKAFHRDLAVKMEICKTITMLHVLQQMICFLPEDRKINNWEIKKHHVIHKVDPNYRYSQTANRKNLLSQKSLKIPKV
jgi:nitrogenase subunit NifH